MHLAVSSLVLICFLSDTIDKRKIARSLLIRLQGARFIYSSCPDRLPINIAGSAGFGNVYWVLFWIEQQGWVFSWRKRSWISCPLLFVDELKHWQPLYVQNPSQPSRHVCSSSRWLTWPCILHTTLLNSELEHNKFTNGMAFSLHSCTRCWVSVNIFWLLLLIWKTSCIKHFFWISNEIFKPLNSIYS